VKCQCGGTFSLPRGQDRASPVLLIPPAVRKELSHGNAPAAMRTRVANPPSWLKVVNLKTSVAAEPSYLDDGEAEAMTLALEQPGTLLLMDDRHGTVDAGKPGLEVVGVR
jgi:predicted nucleic acid-binding protein